MALCAMWYGEQFIDQLDGDGDESVPGLRCDQADAHRPFFTRMPYLFFMRTMQIAFS